VTSANPGENGSTPTRTQSLGPLTSAALRQLDLPPRGRRGLGNEPFYSLPSSPDDHFLPFTRL
jgi:hypothetical protein